MPFFPMFTNLEDKNILVVGGGVVASRKIETLLAFKPKKITVVAKQVNDFIEYLEKEWVVTLHKRAFEKRDLDGQDIVIVAADDIDLQAELFEMCKSLNIPINCVDVPKYCSFIFPSVITKGDFVIGISTSGKAPLISKSMRKFIEKIIPDNIDSIIKDVSKIRRSKLKKEEKDRALVDTIKQKLHLNGL